MSVSKIDPRQTKVSFLTEVANYLLHLYAGAPALPAERLARDDDSNAQYVWYRFVRNRDYMLLEKQSPNPDSCLNDIITENYPLLKPSFGALSRLGEHAFGVSEDRTYHHYFLLLPPKDELVLDADPLDKFLKKLVKRAHSFLKAFANGAPPALEPSAAAPPPPPLPLPVVAATSAAPPPQQAQQAQQAPQAQAVAAVAPPPQPVVVSAAAKRDRDAVEQAAKDQEALRELQKEELVAKRARLADEAKRKADAEQQRQLDEQERAAKAEADEKARIAAEQLRLEQERRDRVAQCPFPKRAPGAVGFVQEPFQTAEGLVVNPWFLLLD